MSLKNLELIAKELNVSFKQVDAVVELLDEGATVPFISRYRKERTGSLDEVAITSIRDRITQLRELDKRKEAILKSIENQEKLTPELEAMINKASSLTELEDIYLPYKPKRKTKASMAREKGLEPLAKQLLEQGNMDVELEAAQYVSEEKKVEDKQAALQGARDIVAEWVNENIEVRNEIRRLFEKEAMLSSKLIKGKEEEGIKYKDYFDWEEKLATAPAHRLLAMRRGEKEMVLSLNIMPDEDVALSTIEGIVVQSNNEAAEQVKTAIADCYKRLLKPSLETEVRLSSKMSADASSIQVFSENLKQLLLAAPLGQKSVLALDPGFRTGCKLVCLDQQGDLIYNDTIYPNEPQKRTAESGALIKMACEKYNIEAIAIGNGTASRETEAFVNGLGLDKSILVVMVNESGASIYSASETAREEFPDYDLTVRGSASIGRRLMDPLAELVKLDPKSIGVGQYQHDVDQTLLKKGLDDVVVSCVNTVGVEVNTASKELLSYVSGLGPQLAKGLVQYRNENGPFTKRNDFKKVARLGDKAYEQCAGFLRIRNAGNPLDYSTVHPERYGLVETMAKDQGCSIQELLGSKEKRGQIKLSNYISEDVGLPTLQDIIKELDKPGRDPREQFEAFKFMDGVNEVSDLSIGMKLPGIVTNITNFGAFVDVGVHQDGLVHVSHLADKFVSNPNEIVKVHQQVEVTVMEVDVQRKRIGLSLKSDPFGSNQPGKSEKSAKNEKRVVKKSGQKRPVNRQDNRSKRNAEPEGDLQSKLEALKGKFKM